MTLIPEFIYFDLDDTLLDHRGAEKAALIDVCDRFKFFNGTDPARLIDTYHQINTRLWKRYGAGEIDRSLLQRKRFEDTLDRLGLDGSRFEEVGTFYMKAYRNHWSWIEGAFDALKRASNRYATGILTNGFSETQKKKQEYFSLDRFSRHFVISEEVGYLKPDPKIFEHATSLTGSTPDGILYIGDSYHSDILGASAYGWNTAWFINGSESEDRKKADFIFNDFDDLCSLLNV